MLRRSRPGGHVLIHRAPELEGEALDLDLDVRADPAASAGVCVALLAWP